MLRLTSNRNDPLSSLLISASSLGHDRMASLFFTMATNRDKGKESLHSPQNSENLKMIQFYNFFLFTLVREWRIEKMFEAWFPPSTRRRARGRRRRESEARSRPGSVTLENMRISDRNSSVFEAAQHFVTHRCSGGGGSLVVRKLSRLWNCGLLCRNEPRGRGCRLRCAAFAARGDVRRNASKR